MTDIPDVIQGIEKLAPGIVGSIGALLWIRGTWPRKIAMMGLGSAASYYGGPHVATLLNMDPGLSGFMIGLFGMSVVDSLFKTWYELGLTELVREFLRSKLGLPASRGE